MLKINKKDIQVKHFSIYSHDCLIIFLDYLKIKSIWPPPGRYYNFVISLSYLSLDKLWRSHSCNIPSVYSYDLFYRFLSLFLINRPYVSPSIFLSLSVLSYHSVHYSTSIPWIQFKNLLPKKWSQSTLIVNMNWMLLNLQTFLK